MGFFDRNRENVTKMGYDDSRLPPGQYLTERFPVLHVGDVPTYAPGEWDLKIYGLVHQPFTLSFEELTALPSVTLTTDIHCVTKWSKFDTVWRSASSGSGETERLRLQWRRRCHPSAATQTMTDSCRRRLRPTFP
ncbi:MAG: hypothetical protein EB132_03975 [Actinobacteria bacterium]|nr:hypothetical protein [Actinomycetota bacterium]